MLRADEPLSYILPLDRLLTPTHRPGQLHCLLVFPTKSFDYKVFQYLGQWLDKLGLVVPVVVCLQSTASAVFHVVDLEILDRNPFDCSRIGTDVLIQSELI